MSTLDRLLLVSLTLALWALVFGHARTHAQEGFQMTRELKEAVERIVDGAYLRDRLNQSCWVNNGEVQQGHRDDVSYVHC